MDGSYILIRLRVGPSSIFFFVTLVVGKVEPRTGVLSAVAVSAEDLRGPNVVGDLILFPCLTGARCIKKQM